MANGEKKRGAGFPSMSLRDAVEMIVAAGERGGVEHTQNAFATYLGHTTHNSGPYRGKLASLRDWGLITRSNDRIVYTPLARDLLKVAPEHLSSPGLLVKAFMNCAPFKALFDDSAKGAVIDRGRLRNLAVVDLNVSPDSADKFVASFIESAITAELGEQADNGGILLRAPEDGGYAIGEAPEPDVAYGDTVWEAKVSRPVKPEYRAQIAASRAMDVALQQVWPFGEGEVIFMIRSTSALPPEAYGLVADVVAKANALAAVLGHGGDTDPPARSLNE